MNNADLTEIRALLRENAPAERAPRRPLLAGLGALFSGASVPAKAPVAPPPARRVGLAQALAAAAQAPTESEEAAARRRAFGQRPDSRAAVTPPLLMLETADPVDIDAVELILRRRAKALLAPRPAEAELQPETPYLPEDLFDHAGADTQQVYDAAGLFEPREAGLAPGVEAALESTPARKSRRRRALKPAPENPAATPMPLEQELLSHLERVCLAEQAALQARL